MDKQLYLKNQLINAKSFNNNKSFIQLYSPNEINNAYKENKLRTFYLLSNDNKRIIWGKLEYIYPSGRVKLLYSNEFLHMNKYTVFTNPIKKPNKSYFRIVLERFLE